MAIPTFVAAGAIASGTGNVTPGLPAGWQANDIHLLLVETQGGEVVTAPSGWTATASSPQESSGGGVESTRLSVFWRRAVGGDTDPTVTDPGNHAVAVILGVRGCPTTGDPWNVSSGGGEDVTDASLTVPGATTTVADCLVVMMASRGSDLAGADFSAWANADLATVTERFDDGSIAGAGGGIGAATGEKAAAGAYGNTTATLGTAARKAYITLALKPVAGGAFTLDAAAGSYALTGAAAELLAGRALDAVAGSYAVTGQAAQLLAARVISADAGVYVLSGAAAGLLAGRVLVANPGAYVLSGAVAELLAGRLLVLDAGAYALSGAVAQLLVGRVLDAASGAYVLTGAAAAALAARVLAADPGAYVVTGVATDLLSGIVIILVRRLRATVPQVVSIEAKRQH